MIGRLHGKLVEKQPPLVVIECAGVGYEVSVPMSTFFNLPGLGEMVTLLVQQIVREDAHLLFGFLTNAERDAFRQLLKVNGVGPKVALAVLSGMSVTELSIAIAEQSSARLTKIPGIGKKTAERLVLELRDKMAGGAVGIAAGLATEGTEGSRGSDVLNALLALGYNDREAASAMKQLPPGLSTSDAIKAALKFLAKP
jgi:holliday junction DNA helicase RuvA